MRKESPIAEKGRLGSWHLEKAAGQDVKGCEAPSSLPFVLDLMSLSTSCLCSYQEMEFLDITSIRDTRFGKFAKMPKVSGPSSSPGSARPPAPRGWGRSPRGAGSLISGARGRVRGLSRGSLPELRKGHDCPLARWGFGIRAQWMEMLRGQLLPLEHPRPSGRCCLHPLPFHPDCFAYICLMLVGKLEEGIGGKQDSLRVGTKNLSSNEKWQTKYTELPGPKVLVNLFLWASPSRGS